MKDDNTHTVFVVTVYRVQCRECGNLGESVSAHVAHEARVAHEKGTGPPPGSETSQETARSEAVNHAE